MKPVVVPPPDDVTTPWWDATRDHRLTVQTCGSCAHVQHPPRAVCLGCSSMTELAQTDATGGGVVDAFTIVYRAARPDLETPYTIARIRLDEGPILLSRLEGSNNWTIGDRVAVGWVDLEDGRALPVFAPDPE